MTVHANSGAHVTLQPGPTSPSYPVDGPAWLEFRPPFLQGKMVLR